MADAQAETRPLHILIPSELHTRLKALAEANDRSVAAETRKAIEGRLEQFEDRDPETERTAAV